MGSPRDLAVRPLGMGEVIDRAVALTVRHFRPLFAAMLVIEAPALALGRVQQARTAALASALADPARAGTTLASLGPAFGALLLVLLVLQIGATAAAAAIVAPSLDPRGEPGPSPGRRLRAVATAGAVQLVALAAAPAGGALPGLLLAAGAESAAARAVGLAAAALGSLGLLLVVVLRLVLVPVVAAVEGRGGLSAALRSARLMAPRAAGRILDRPGVRASLVLLATFLLALAVNGLAGIPRAIAARLAGAAGPLGLLGGALPLAVEVPVSILEAAATAALQPFSLVAIAVLYFDRRARTEALDVEIWAARLEAER
jgi:hypothetical protein